MNNRIKELRTKLLKERDGKKYTQKDFADKLEMSENYICMIEKGERIPADRTVGDKCRILGMSSLLFYLYPAVSRGYSCRIPSLRRWPVPSISSGSQP